MFELGSRLANSDVTNTPDQSCFRRRRRRQWERNAPLARTPIAAHEQARLLTTSIKKLKRQRRRRRSGRFARRPSRHRTRIFFMALRATT